jgi:branched-subunit amino acid ABC-type transport system permease component
MLVEQVINGVVLGSMYALIAQGYTLVFGVLDKLNFAHGEIFMLGGFICLASIALGASLPHFHLGHGYRLRCLRTDGRVRRIPQIPFA